MTPELFLAIAVRPALGLLPSSMHSREAEAMVLAICLQESRLQHRHQIGGPAVGYPQFELGLVGPSDRVVGGVASVLAHPATRAHALMLCRVLDITPSARHVYAALPYQDVLAAGLTRLLLWTLPVRLPLAHEVERAWQQYLEAWRPGKPHRHTWDAQYARAWQAVA